MSTATSKDHSTEGSELARINEFFWRPLVDKEILSVGITQ